MSELAYVRACRTAWDGDVQAVIAPPRGPARGRVVVRRDGGDVTLEPFVGNASVAALLGNRRKLADAVSLLCALVFEARRHADEVLVVRRREGAAEAAAVDCAIGRLGEALRARSTTLRVLGVLRRYCISAEVTPIAGADGTPTLAIYEVVAATEPAARATLRSMIAPELRLVAVRSLELVGMTQVEDRAAPDGALRR